MAQSVADHQGNCVSDVLGLADPQAVEYRVLEELPSQAEMLEAVLADMAVERNDLFGIIQGCEVR